MTFTKAELTRIIESADEVITALAGTNDDIHPDNSTKMCAAWDHLNDVTAPPSVVKRLAEMALAGMEAEPVFTINHDSSLIKHVKKVVRETAAPQPLTTSERSELENYRNAQQVDSSGMQRDALRYRFMRDKDAFGDEDEPGLTGWDGLSELDGNAFDSAVDARILQSGIPLYTASEKQVIPADADVYAELHRLRAEIKGPDGFDTWKDAAIFERTARIKLGKAAQEIDYLTAMAAYHSEQWHKMSPITGYMNGWNACRAAMLQGKADGNSPVIPDGLCPCCGRKQLKNRACSVAGCDGKHVAHGFCKKHYDIESKKDPSRRESIRAADERYRVRKSAAPQQEAE